MGFRWAGEGGGGGGREAYLLVVPEDGALLKHGVYQRRLAVICIIIPVQYSTVQYSTSSK